MIRAPLEGSRQEAVAVVLGPEDSGAAAEVLCRLGFAVQVHPDAKSAADAWEAGKQPCPDCVLIALEDPDLGRATQVLRRRGEAPILFGAYAPGLLARAVAAMREGFYDCVPSPLGPEEVEGLVLEGLTTRQQYRQAAPDAASLRVLLGLAGKRETRATAEAAAEALRARLGPCALVVSGLSYPGASPWAPPAETWETIGRTGRVRLSPDELPPALAGDEGGEATLLAPGVLCVRSGGHHHPTTLFERVVASLVALVAEADHLRNGQMSPERRAVLERLARIGESADRLHHDINNPLCAISLNAQLLAMALGESNPKLEARVRTIEENTRRIQQIVERLARAKNESLAEAELVAASET